MRILLAALGMVACMAVMMVLMPLGMRLVDRLRRRPGQAHQPEPPASTDATRTRQQR